MKKHLRYLFVVLLGLVYGSAYAEDKTDELTWEGLGLNASNTSNAEFSEKTFNSSAVYAGTASSGQGKYIQLRSNKSDAGIVTTKTGGKLKSVTITFNEATTDRAIDIYGKNEPYTKGPDMYGDAKGELIGSIAANGASMTITPDQDYAYVGMVAQNGAIYIDKITVVWEEGGQTSTKTATAIEFSGDYMTRATCGKDEKVSLPTATVKAGDAAVAGASVTWSSSNEDLAKIEGGKISIPNHVYGKVTITATYAGNDSYESSKKAYTLTVYKGYMSLNSMWEDFTDANNGDELKAGVLGSYWQVAMEGDNIVSKEAVVTYVNGSYTYINDGQNDMLFYGSNLGFQQGDKITGDLGNGQIGAVYGTLKTYNGLLEFATSAADIEFRVVSSGNAVTPKEITPEALVNNMNAYVKIAAAKYSAASGKSLTFVSPEGKEFTVYNQWNVDVSTLEQDKSYALIGTGSYYKDTIQLNLISFAEVDVTSINTIAVKKTAVVYNAAGQQLTAPQKGLNIVDGKKVWVK